MNPRRIAQLFRERARIDELIAEEFESREVELDGVEYSSTSLPPGITSREHFATECRRRRIGQKHGRVWVVSARDWVDARTAKKARLRVVDAPESATQMADADIDAVQPRQTRRAR